MTAADDNLKKLIETLANGDEEEALALLAKFDGLVQNVAYYAPRNWNDDLVQDVRIQVYEWLRQLVRKENGEGRQDDGENSHSGGS